MKKVFETTVAGRPGCLSNLHPPQFAQWRCYDPLRRAKRYFINAIPWRVPRSGFD
jgi:hypothetical protein